MEFLTFGLVLLLPIVLLAIGGAIECLFAGTADLVFSKIALWGLAEVALLDKIRVLLALLGSSLLFLDLLDVLEPLDRGIVLPRIKVLDLRAFLGLVRELLGRELVHEVVFLLQENLIETMLKVVLHQI